MSIILTGLQQRRLFRIHTGIPFSSNRANKGQHYYLYNRQNYDDLWAKKTEFFSVDEPLKLKQV